MALLVDENLDVVDGSEHVTVSGSQCVKDIRDRLPPESERRLFALIRSANDSASDIAMYCTRAHGFLPKAPIKREKVHEILAPLWLKRFPPSEFEETMDIPSSSIKSIAAPTDSIACSPFDVAQKLTDIESLFENNAHETKLHLIHDEMHILKGDLLTLNSNISVKLAVAQIDLIQVTHTPDKIIEKWHALKNHINNIIQSLYKSFQMPIKKTFCVAIDDSKIQRKVGNHVCATY